MHWAEGAVSQNALGRGVCIPACTEQGVSALGMSVRGTEGVSAQGCVADTPQDQRQTPLVDRQTPVET